MSERNENKVYIIPPDFIQSGTLFGGLVRQYNQDTMLPIAENLSDYFVSSFEIRQYSCVWSASSYNKIFCFSMLKVSAAEFFIRRSEKFAARLTPCKNERKAAI